MHQKEKEICKKIALERIEILFDLMEKETLKRNYERANRYLKIAREISTSYNIRLRGYKIKYCRYCNIFFNSENSRVRLNPKKHRIEIECLKCGKKKYFGYLQEQKEKRRTKYLKKVKNKIKEG